MQTIPVQIRFNDVDMFGHVNNAVYLQYLDMGKYAYFRSMMDGGDFGSEPTAPVVANINIDFMSPAHIDDSLSVHTCVSDVGDSSITLQQSIVDAAGEEKCRARVIMVNVDTRTGRPVTVSDLWRKRFGTEEGKQFKKVTI